MDTRLFLADGIKVGLGTDVAGGHSASMVREGECVSVF